MMQGIKKPSIAVIEDIDSSKWLYRFLIILTSITFLHFFPRLLFIVYMGSHGFFDYSFFEEGFFAIQVFYGTTELLLVIASLMMFGALVPILRKIRHGKSDFTLLIISLTTNLAVLFLIARAVLKSESGDFVDVIVLFVLSFLIALHIAIVCNEKARTAFLSTLGVFSFVFCLLAISPSSVAGLLSLGLTTYNAGGNVPIKVQQSNQPPRTGRLTFLGPKHIFMQFEGEKNLTILERSQGWQISFAAPKR